MSWDGLDDAARANDWIEIEYAGQPPFTRCFIHRGRHLQALLGRELGRLHLSVAHKKRIPTWPELGFARDSLLPPDGWFMIAHPPRSVWLNFDERVLHLWEFNDPVLIQQFVIEGEAARRLGFNRPTSGMGEGR